MLLRILLWFVLGVGPVFSETWTTQAGEVFAGRLSGVYGPLVVIAHEHGSRRIVVEALDDAGVRRVADFVAARPTARPTWADSRSAIARALKGKLAVVRGGKSETFEPKDSEEPEFYLILYGAGANEGTRRFIPGLISRYETLRGRVGKRFEIVYVGRDGVPEEYAQFVRESGMPWPYVRFSARDNIKVIDRWAESGIPSLVVVNAAGDLVLDSVQANGGFRSPDEVFREFEAWLALLEAESPAAKRAMHRLAVLQHVRACGEGEHPPRPYVLALDRTRYATLATQRVVATLALDEKGRVAEVSLEPKQEAVLANQFAQDAGRWLFLPGVKNGQPQPFTIKLPIEF